MYRGADAGRRTAAETLETRTDAFRWWRSIRYRDGMTPPPVHVAGGSGVARVFRYLYRVPLLLVHLLVFLPVTLQRLSPLLVWIRVGDENAGDVAVRWWSGA